MEPELQRKFPETNGLKVEIQALITRWSHESDITVSEVLGVLEMIQAEELHRWLNANS